MTIALPSPDLPQLKIDHLANHDALSSFECGVRDIDRAINTCCDWHDKYRARVFCATLDSYVPAYGFYALSMFAREQSKLGGAFDDKQEDRQFIPFIYLNYLAVQTEFQNRKIGSLLLVDALLRCEPVARTVGVYGIGLNALSERAVGLYDRYGFREYGGRKNYPFMVLPIQSLFDVCKQAKAQLANP